MKYLIWILAAFLCGSLPFSVWLGKVFLGLDVRQFGDGNPGATNVFRAGSPLLGVASLVLDVGKAALPIGICYHNLGFSGLPMLAISLAPLLGHMYSPFLGFKGGKALAAALGVWIGLTTWQASLPAVAGVVLGILLLSTTGWAVMLSMAAILAVLLAWIPDPLLFAVWFGETALLAWTHREDLAQPPSLSARLKRIFQRGQKEKP